MKAMAAPNDRGEDDDDVGALIYRESQLRKAEAAAAAAAERKKTLSASAHNELQLGREHLSTTRATSTRTRTPVDDYQCEEPLPSKRRTGALKRKKREPSSEDEDRPRKNVAKKKYRYECSADGCTNKARKGGVCIRHGAKEEYKRCSSEGCTNFSIKGGVCIRHGAKTKRCSSEGCTNHVVKGGVCIRHGASVKQCSSEGCTNAVIKGGVCVRHGAKLKRCKVEGCTNLARKGGVCVKHGAKGKLCSSDGCTNQAKRGGVCWRHGASRNTHETSTAFGSEFEMTTATKTLPNQTVSRVAVREGQEGSGIPREVAILCQEIVEV